MAIGKAESGEGGGGGETRTGGSSRLQVFLSTLISSIGGVFGANFQDQDSEEDMASRAVVVVPRQQVLRGPKNNR